MLVLTGRQAVEGGGPLTQVLGTFLPWGHNLTLTSSWHLEHLLASPGSHKCLPSCSALPHTAGIACDGLSLVTDRGRCLGLRTGSVGLDFRFWPREPHLLGWGSGLCGPQASCQAPQPPSW